MSIFSAFYTEFSGRARSFDIFDAHDAALWPCPLPFDQLYVFASPAHACAALRLFPDRFARLPMPVFMPPLRSLPPSPQAASDSVSSNSSSSSSSPSSSSGGSSDLSGPSPSPLPPLTHSATGVASQVELALYNCSTVMLNICTQCNMCVIQHPYAPHLSLSSIVLLIMFAGSIRFVTQLRYIPRYPPTRARLPAYYADASTVQRFASIASGIPNFYTDNMCRKATARSAFI
jgi:hypothetical protein